MTSFASAKGPSVTVTLPPESLCTRTPVVSSSTPSHSISHPAFMPSSMSLSIPAPSASVGWRWDGPCVKTLIKRMSILLVCNMLSDSTVASRHETEILFGANYHRRDLHCLHGAPLPQVGTYVSLTASSPTGSAAISRRGGRAPAKYGLPRPST